MVRPCTSPETVTTARFLRVLPHPSRQVNRNPPYLVNKFPEVMPIELVCVWVIHFVGLQKASDMECSQPPGGPYSTDRPCLMFFWGVDLVLFLSDAPSLSPDVRRETSTDLFFPITSVNAFRCSSLMIEMVSKLYHEGESPPKDTESQTCSPVLLSAMSYSGNPPPRSVRWICTHRIPSDAAYRKVGSVPDYTLSVSRLADYGGLIRSRHRAAYFLTSPPAMRCRRCDILSGKQESRNHGDAGWA